MWKPSPIRMSDADAASRCSSRARAHARAARALRRPPGGNAARAPSFRARRTAAGRPSSVRPTLCAPAETDLLDRVRQQPEQRGAEQRTGREADQMRQHAGAQRLRRDQEQRRRESAESAAEQGEQHDPGEQRHSYFIQTSVAMRPVVPSRRIGIEPVAIRVAAKPAAEDLRNTEPRELAPGEIVQVRLPAAARVGRERVRVVGRARDELLANFGTDFELVLFDRGSEPGKYAFRRNAHRAQRALENSAGEAAPTCVSGRDARAIAIAQEHRQAVGCKHDASLAGRSRERCIGSGRRVVRQSPRQQWCREPDSARADRAATRVPCATAAGSR